MTESQYIRAINRAQLYGFDYMADALWCLYLFDYPPARPAQANTLEGPRDRPYSKDCQ
jgi:hypothetical protein